MQALRPAFLNVVDVDDFLLWCDRGGIYRYDCRRLFDVVGVHVLSVIRSSNKAAKFFVETRLRSANIKDLGYCREIPGFTLESRYLPRGGFVYRKRGCVDRFPLCTVNGASTVSESTAY